MHVILIEFGAWQKFSVAPLCNQGAIVLLKEKGLEECASRGKRNLQRAARHLHVEMCTRGEIEFGST